MLLQKIVNQDGNIIAPFTKGWHVNRKHVDAIVKIIAESSVRYHCAKVAVRCSNNPNINLDRACAANATNLAFLKSAQKFRLHPNIQFRNLVKKERAAIRNLEETFLFGVRARERAFLVAEEFRFKQVLVDRGAVDSLKHLRHARTLIVNRACDEFLACAGLAANQDGRA